MAAILGGIAADDEALHTGGMELMDLGDLGNDPTLDARLRGPDDFLIFDDVILALLVEWIGSPNGLAVNFAHEATLFAAVFLVESNQFLAELGLEDIRQEQNGGLQREAGVLIDRR